MFTNPQYILTLPEAEVSFHKSSVYTHTVAEADRFSGLLTLYGITHSVEKYSAREKHLLCNA